MTDKKSHRELLQQIETGVAQMAAELAAAELELEGLRDLGVFLDGEGRPVVPGWWDRKDGDGAHVAWYLVWPSSYAAVAGLKRRQYVKAAEVAITREVVARTQEYAGKARSRDAIASSFDRLRRDLQDIVWRHNLDPERVRRRW